MLFRLQQSSEESFTHSCVKELNVRNSWLLLHRKWKRRSCFW